MLDFYFIICCSEHGVSGVIRASNKIVKSKRVNGLCRKDSCYILQDDQLCPLFTVSEIMFIAANLKIGKSMTKSSKEYLVIKSRLILF